MAGTCLIDGVRTPMGRFLGGLSPLKATELGGQAIAALLERTKIDVGLIDQVAMGQVVTAGAGQAPARQAAILGGVPANVGAVTLNKVCGSGLYSVMLADMAIRSGEMRCVVAGGMESMSNGPHLMDGGRTGWKYGAKQMVDAVEFDGLFCSIGKTGMGCYADGTASKYTVSREDQDAWALQSHQRAIAAIAEGRFDAEICNVVVPDRKQSVEISRDEGPRADSSAEVLGKLRPAFASDGTVTAGNASPLSDGAAAVLAMDEDFAKSLGMTPKFRVLAQAVHAGEPSEIFVAPVGAVSRVLEKAGKQVGDVDLFELNEAFAAQTVACQRQLDIPSEKLNVLGGAIALGHPLGCSGTRVLVTLMHALEHQQKHLGVAALCLGGGEAVAMVIERIGSGQK